MKRIANILTGFTIAVMFSVASAQAQNDGTRMVANIPFEFTAGNTSLPAGQYEFVRTGDSIYLIRDENGRSFFVRAGAPIDGNHSSLTSSLKFVTINGQHVLSQIWSDRALIGNEFQYTQSSVEVAKQTGIHGIVGGRR